MNKVRLLLFVLSCAMPFTGIAQDDFDDFLKRHNTSFGNFVKERNAEYEAFRKKVNEEYAAMLEQAWKDMSTENYTNLVYDCLQIRKEKHLCDWAYLEMLRCMSEKLYGKGTNSATLLMAYVYCQSGYKMRLARGANGKLYMLYASKHIIYDKSYYDVGGV